MALSTPFINSIPAFDAENNITLNISVLGGDVVTSFIYSIYENDTNNLVTSQIVNVSGDKNSESIRTFPFQISANTLQNNREYRITAFTKSGDSSSTISNYQLITCYKTPSFAFKYNNGTEYVSLLDGYRVLSPELPVQIEFNTNDEYSNAVLNSVNLQLFGIKSDGKQELVFDGNTLYNSPLNQTIKNFSPTTNGIYASFTLLATGTTTDNMVFTNEVTGLLCSYATASESTSLLRVENICNSGLINIFVDLSSLTQTFTKIVISYKEENDIDWISIQEIQQSDLSGRKQFTFNFSYCGSNRIYNFKLDIYSGDNIVLIEDIKSVLSYFNKNYICDKDVSYDTTIEYQLGSVQLNSQVSTYEPYGSPFPIISKNAVTKYREAQTTALLLAPTTIDNTSAEIDRFAQVKLVDEFNDWLSNGRAKVLKDFNGNLRIIAVTTSISNDYYKQLGNGIASTSFSWKEVGGFNQEYLKKLRMINNFNINYISN